MLSINQCKILLVLCLSSLLIGSCKDPKLKSGEITKISTSSSIAADPYLTKDNNGNAVLCWTEQSTEDSLFRLKYAVYDKESGKFGEAITVSSSVGTKASSESMNKIAYKADGSIVAVFGKRFENEKSPYAGAIYYSISSDKGRSWSKASFLHSDTSHHYGRSFFDVATLKDGEVAAIWLDGRYGGAETGSALFFARTQKGQGFGRDKCISKSTCECCRTDLFCDEEGNLHIAYRSILYPPALLGKQVRDMVYTSSRDNGNSFSLVKAISRDNWAIEGCPHTGPALAVTNKKVHAIWFTAGGNPGLYYNFAASSETDFMKRTSVSSGGRHPQMVSLPDERLAIIWEENVASNVSLENKDKGHQHSKMNNDRAGSFTRIVLRVQGNGESDDSYVTDGKTADHHPVVVKLDKNLLLAWVREEMGSASVCYSYIEPK